jgi:hypothetical protein
MEESTSMYIKRTVPGPWSRDTYRRYLKAGTRHRATVPMTRVLKLIREEQRTTVKQQEYVDAFQYQELLESLLYLAVNTRPDITFAVNACARFSNSPKYAVCRTLVQILDYVSNTCTVGIVYRGADFDIHGFCDSDWAGDIDTRRSVYNWLSNLNGWWSNCVAVSSADYYGNIVDGGRVYGRICLNPGDLLVKGGFV